jgi:hypothetical protein
VWNKHWGDARVIVDDLALGESHRGIEHFVQVRQLQAATIDIDILISRQGRLRNWEIELLGNCDDVCGKPLFNYPITQLQNYQILYPFVFSICSACFSEVSVSFAPLIMRATSSVRSGPLILRTLVRVRSPARFFSIR